VSGCYQNWSADSPGGLNESTAAVAAGIAEAMSAVQSQQVVAAEFFTAYGQQVLGGHPGTHGPGGGQGPQ
jgi:hypothetical protein